MSTQFNELAYAVHRHILFQSLNTLDVTIYASILCKQRTENETL